MSKTGRYSTIATSWLTTCLFILSSCNFSQLNTSKPSVHSPQTTPFSNGGFGIKSLQSTEPPPAHLEQVQTLPADPAYELRFESGTSAANVVHMPAEGEFKVSVEVGAAFALLDNDATDGMARIQVPAHVFDIYLRPEQNIQANLCQGTGSTTQCFRMNA